MNDTLINFGSEIKMAPDGKLGGYLVRFTSADSPDLAGDFFTKDTDFGIEDGAKTPVYLNHRLPLKTKGGGSVVVKQKIGEGTLKVDESGVLIEAILFEREKYEQALTKMGWSSGTASHLTDREKSGKAFHVKHWPLGLDASITPRPCDPGNVVSLKSFIDQLELEDESGPNAVKNVFEEELAERKLGVWQLQSAFETSMRKLATVAAASSVTDVTVDVEARVGEAVASYAQRLSAAVLEQINEFIESPNQEHFYLKSLFEELGDDGLPAGLPFAERLEMARAAVERVARDAHEIQGMRVKAGRVISAANRTRIQAVIDAISPLLDDLTKLMEESEPPQAKSVSFAALRMQTLRLQSQIAGVPLSRG